MGDHQKCPLSAFLSGGQIGPIFEYKCQRDEETAEANDKKLINLDYMLGFCGDISELSLDARGIDMSELKSLLKLERLAKLRLNCEHNNMNHFLRALGKKGIMVEMELHWVKVDDEFHDILTSFEKLKLLYISPSKRSRRVSSIPWPANLKHLRLQNFELTFIAFMSIIQQLQSLESLDLLWCFFKFEEKNNALELSRQIIKTINYSDRKQQLNVLLPLAVNLWEDRSKNFLVDSELLKIHLPQQHPYGNDPLRINIHSHDQDHFVM